MKKVDSNLYNHDYYMSNNVGYEEFKEGLKPDKINYKFRHAMQYCSFSSEKTVLDIGCGRGELVYYAAQKGCNKAIGIDYSSAAINIARSFAAKLDKNIRDRMIFLNKDVLKLSENEKFDYIFMIDVWEHMFDHQLTPLLSKINNLLKDNGFFIITTPNGFYEKFLYPVKRIFNIPFNLIKFPLRIVRGKWKPKSAHDLIRHIFKIKPFKNDFMDKTHINISTPYKVKRMLKNAGFLATFKFSDNSKRSFGSLFFHWKAQEMLIIARISGK